jgi:copper chaperone CopZ
MSCLSDVRGIINHILKLDDAKKKRSVKVSFSDSQVAIQVDGTAGRRIQMEFIRGAVNVWPSC